MHPAQGLRSSESTSGLEEVRQLLATSLSHRWFIKVEHADDIGPRGDDWQAWKDCHVTPKNPQALIDDILTCHARFPHHHIRLYAERSQPQTRMVYWVDLPRANATGQAVEQGDGKILDFRAKTLGWVLMLAASAMLVSYVLLGTSGLSA